MNFQESYFKDSLTQFMIDEKIPALEGGPQLRSKPFPRWPMSDDNELRLITDVVRSCNWWRATGNKVTTFETLFADYHDAHHALGVTNGTHAIELALSGLDIAPGSEVIVPAFTFVSTATAVLCSNLVPVFADCDPNTFCIDPSSIRRLINRKTRAIIPVHIGGHVCDMDEISVIAKRFNLRIIEDAAHAHGAEWKGQKVGTFGDIGVFSFQNRKIMTCGEGGALVTNDTKLFDKLYLLHSVGRPRNDVDYQHLALGSNYRMNEFQAAVLIAQLGRLEEANRRRQMNAKLLDSFLSSIEGIKIRKSDTRVTVNPNYMYMFYYNPESFGGLARQDFISALNAEGIPAHKAYPLVYDTRFYREREFGMYPLPQIETPHCPNATAVSGNVVWVPHNVLLGSEDDLRDIGLAISKIQRYYALHRDLKKVENSLIVDAYARPRTQ